MNQDDKIERWKRFGRARGWTAVYPTPPERLVNHLLGRQCRPAVFWSPWLVGAFGGVVAGLMTFAVSWVMFGRAQVMVGAVTGLLFGFVAGTSQFNRRNKCGVTTWEEFGDF